MYTIYTDIQQTRRKRFHHVVDERGTILWSGQTVEGALEWIIDQGFDVFRIEGERKVFTIALSHHDKVR